MVLLVHSSVIPEYDTPFPNVNSRSTPSLPPKNDNVELVKHQRYVCFTVNWATMFDKRLLYQAKYSSALPNEAKIQY